MNVLGIDTTTKIASVSLEKNGTIFSNSIDNEITHSEKLLPLIDKTLKEANTLLKDIDMYACINGPGSFTGIRIGLSTIKAFAEVYKKDIFSISSLDITGYETYILNNLDEMYAINLIDARNDRVYYNMEKIFKKDNKIVIENILKTSNDLIGDAIFSLTSVIAEKSIEKNNIYISGNAVNKFSEKLLSLSKNIKDFYPTTDTLIHAVKNIADTENYLFNAFILDAMYARESQAERMQK